MDFNNYQTYLSSCIPRTLYLTMSCTQTYGGVTSGGTIKLNGRTGRIKEKITYSGSGASGYGGIDSSLILGTPTITSDGTQITFDSGGAQTVFTLSDPYDIEDVYNDALYLQQNWDIADVPDDYARSVGWIYAFAADDTSGIMVPTISNSYGIAWWHFDTRYEGETPIPDYVWVENVTVNALEQEAYVDLSMGGVAPGYILTNLSVSSQDPNWPVYGTCLVESMAIRDRCDHVACVWDQYGQTDNVYWPCDPVNSCPTPPYAYYSTSDDINPGHDQQDNAFTETATPDCVIYIPPAPINCLAVDSSGCMGNQGCARFVYLDYTVTDDPDNQYRPCIPG